jgi:hypothetical protein
MDDLNTAPVQGSSVLLGTVGLVFSGLASLPKLIEKDILSLES